MYKGIRKSMIILGAATVAAGSVSPSIIAENAKNDKVKYADGTYTGEGYGYYKQGSKFDKGKHKGELRPPLKISVTFSGNKITDIKLYEDDNYVFPDDPSYSNKGQKSLAFLKKSLLASDNYEETINQIKDKLNEIVDQYDDDGYLKSSKMPEYDVITSATRTTQGYIDAVKDSIEQAKNKANEVLNVKNIELVGKDDNTYYAGDDYNISKLKVKVTYEDDTTKIVEYDSFKKNNLDIEVLQGGKNVLVDGKINLENIDGSFTIIITDHNNKQKKITLPVIPKFKQLLINNLYYRIGGEGEFKAVAISGELNKKEYDIDVKSSDLGDMIEFKTTEFINDVTNEIIKQEYYFKPVLLENNINKKFVVIANRHTLSPEDSSFISPVRFKDGEIRINYNKTFKDDIDEKKAELEKLINENRNSNDERIKHIVETYDNLYKEVENAKSEKLKLEGNLLKLKDEYEELGKEKKKAMAEAIEANKKFRAAEQAYENNKSEENKQKLDEAKKLKDEKKANFDKLNKQWNNKYNEMNEVGKKITELEKVKVSNHDLALILKDLKAILQPGQSEPIEESHDTASLKKQIQIKIDELINLKDGQSEKIKKLFEAKIEKSQKFLQQVNKEDDKTNYLVYEWYIKELDYAKSKSTNNLKPNESNKKKIDKTDKENLNKIKVDRVSGGDRFDTSVEMSKKYFKTSETVIIASGENYPDALSAAALAGVEKAPILLVSKDNIKKSVLDEIKRLGAKKVIIVGGINSIDSNIAKSINGIAKVELIAGKDRYETSKKIAKKVMKNGYRENMLIVDGKNYPDSLTASSLIEKYKAPILLVNDDRSGMSNVDFAKESNVKSNIILGGTKSVSTSIEKKLNNSKRIAGKNRYETSKKIAKEVIKDNGHIFITNGKIYADSLSAGPSVIKDKGVLLLIDGSNVNSNMLKEYKPSKVVAVGGSSSINSKVLESINK
ncbi:cell wall-binding repeat-containing protein [Peptostreptococcus canis]|uniref:FMN-binding protein n=1 Tax=Peptostreptococcus canis TaxID=1159213 RepID=A0ABR6TKW8_9FIRM|nr:cell wall-binding repeat-containing protein [Peptostreptococcus canis]MBC2575793.1 FMN-binding protein [Peptostreptococcus canis]MBP1998092.1 putative cell wall-binding protein/uncharacterized protein with FMN-binding domain [Peptostreptococcus canis]